MPDLVRRVASGRKRVCPEVCQLREAESLHTKPGVSSKLHGTFFKPLWYKLKHPWYKLVQTEMPDLVCRVAFGGKRVCPQVGELREAVWPAPVCCYHPRTPALGLFLSR